MEETSLVYPYATINPSQMEDYQVVYCQDAQEEIVFISAIIVLIKDEVEIHVCSWVRMVVVNEVKLDLASESINLNVVFSKQAKEG